MRRPLRLLRSLVFAIWIGSGVFLAAVAAPAAFRLAPNRTVAADLVGAMLSKWHYIAVLSPILLLLFEWYVRRLSSTTLVVTLSIASILGAAQVGADLRARSLRINSPVPISSLAPHDPVRKQFGMLHGISTLLMLAQIVTAAAALSQDHDSSKLGEIRRAS